MTTAPRHPEDRALNAVRRVRDSREQDSRFGLQHALSSLEKREHELRLVSDQRTQTPLFAQGSPRDFAAHTSQVARLAGLEQLAVARARDSRLVAEEARNRWQRDRQKVRVVDGLLQRRALERAQERARHEARELDDMASQAWQRQQVLVLDDHRPADHADTRPADHADRNGVHQ